MYMKARYNGFSATGRKIKKGDTIFWDASQKKAYLPGDTLPGGSIPGDTLPGGSIPGDTLPVEIDTFVIGGQSFYRNKRGRCEDAPCCGCCTI